MRSMKLTATAIFCASLAGAAQGTEVEDIAKEIIANQIRKQGFACTMAVKADPDPAHTRPDLKAWILTCSDAVYRVILVPDRAARVERIN